MDIWILVIVLLVIAIVLLGASFYGEEESDIDEKLSEFSIQQSEELYQIKTRLSELEQGHTYTNVNENIYDNYSNGSTVEDYLVEEAVTVEAEEVSDDVRDRVIQLYSQGYTMHEMNQEVHLTPATIQAIVDDYIENR